MRAKINIHNADCMPAMAEMKDNEYDLAIVDPPYGIGDCINSLGKRHHKKINWNNETPTQEYFNELIRVSKNQIIWGINYYTKFVRQTGRIVHDKTGLGMRQNPKELSNVDLASHSFNNTMKIFHHTWIGNVQGKTINWRNEGIDKRIHPTQKPIALYKWLLKNYAKHGDKILDTHLGSGSIAIACWDGGFDLTGYEIDKDYYKAAMKRFNNHTKQLQLW